MPQPWSSKLSRRALLACLLTLGLLAGSVSAGNYTVFTLPGAGGGAGGGAPTTAQYWTGAADGDLSAEKNLGALATGLVLNTSGTPTAYGGAACTNQLIEDLNASGAPTCRTITSAYVDGTIATGVGDCAGGACYDGTSDGGTYARLYDGDSHYGQVQTANLTANRTYTMPNWSGIVDALALPSAETASFTAVVGSMHRVNLGTNSAHIEVTFPATPSAGDRFGYYVGTANTTDGGASGYAVAPFWGVEANNPTIDSAAYSKSSGAGTGQYGLWLSGEMLLFRYVDATVGWVVEYDGRKRHMTKIYNGISQSLTHNATTALAFDNNEYDTCGCRDLANERILPKRRGTYTISAAWASTAASVSGDKGDVQVFVNGAIRTIAVLVLGPAISSQRVTPRVVDMVALTEAQAVTAQANAVRGSGSTAFDTATNDWNRTYLVIREE